MKQLLIAAIILLPAALMAQVTEGKIIYERTFQLQIRIAEENPAFQNMIPKERKDRFELLFGEGKSLWQPVVDETPGDEMSWSDGGGARIVMRMPGSEDITYHNINEEKRVEQRELGGKKYIVTDSIRKMTWKITGEKKEIMGYQCMQATTERTQEAMRMNMDNGKMTRQRVIDTLQISAWFTSEIPGSYGPEAYEGQLPGTILELNVNNGRTVFKAIELSSKIDVGKIKEPTKGKKVNQEEFALEREKLFEEMQHNAPGGGVRMQIRN